MIPLINRINRYFLGTEIVKLIWKYCYRLQSEKMMKVLTEIKSYKLSPWTNSDEMPLLKWNKVMGSHILNKFFFSPSQYLIYWAQLVNWNFSLELSAFISRIANNSASGKSNLSSGFFADTCNIRWRRWINTQQIRFEKEREVENRERFKCTKTQKNLSSAHEIIFQQKQKILACFTNHQ